MPTSREIEQRKGPHRFYVVCDDFNQHIDEHDLGVLKRYNAEQIIADITACPLYHHIEEWAWRDGRWTKIADHHVDQGPAYKATPEERERQLRFEADMGWTGWPTS